MIQQQQPSYSPIQVPHTGNGNGNTTFQSPAKNSQIRFKFNIKFLGDSNVGKSSIIKRYSQGQFNLESSEVTVGIDIASKSEVVNGEFVTLKIWVLYMCYYFSGEEIKKERSLKFIF